MTCDVPCLFPLPCLAPIFSFCFQRSHLGASPHALWEALSTVPAVHDTYLIPGLPQPLFPQQNLYAMPGCSLPSSPPNAAREYVKLSLNPRVLPPLTANADPPFVPGNSSIPTEAERDSAFKTLAADPYRNPDVCCSHFLSTCSF